MIEISGRCLLRLIRMLEISKCQESKPQASYHLFIEPQGSKSRWAVRVVNGHTDWTQPCV
jgi:hypothetical protein